MKFIHFSFFFAFLVLGASCTTEKKQEETTQEKVEKKAAALPQEVQRLAFGSCNKHDKPQEYWQHIAATKPDLWLWLGDIIYGDTEDMKALEEMYAAQKTNPHYSAFLENTPAVGIWDDHDYGVNDGDKSYPQRETSKTLLMNFLDVPEAAPVRQREGAYQAFTFGAAGQEIKLILLDTRYFRDSLERAPKESEQRYVANATGDILGEAQWEWLRKELTNSTAQIHLIGTSIQLLQKEQAYEKWANFPQAHERFFALLRETQAARVVLLSGDRHISELAKMDLEGYPWPLYEATSSGLTHTWSGGGEEENRYRQGPLLVKKSFAALEMHWPDSALALNFYSTETGEVLHADTLALRTGAVE